MPPDRELALRREGARLLRRLAALFDELHELGVVGASSSVAWQITNYLAITPGEHAPLAIAEALAIDPHVTRALLSKLARTRKVARPGEGRYTALSGKARAVTPSRRPPVRDEPLPVRVERAVAASKAPMSPRDVLRRLELPPPKLGAVERALEKLAKDTRIRRTPTGSFRPNTPPRAPRIQRLERFVAEAPGAVTVDTILGALGVPVRAKKTLESRMPSMTEHVARVVLEAKKEMTTAEVLDALKMPVREPTVRALLFRLAHRGALRRVRNGVYAAPTLAPKAVPSSSKQSKPSAPAALSSPATPHANRSSLEHALFDAIESEPAGATLETLAAKLDGDDDDIDEALRALLAAKRVQRVRRGVYVTLR